MNIAIIFAGGTGTRIHNKSKPKQFLEINGKPIIIQTLEVFDETDEIDRIIVVCLGGWIDYLQKLIKKNNVRKVAAIIEGGSTGFESRLKGLMYAKENYSENDIILLHDGVRPLVYRETIIDNISTVKKYGAAVTVSPATESLVMCDGDIATTMTDRKKCFLARAPQSFYLKDVYDLYQRAKKDGNTSIPDTASMYLYYGKKLATVIGPMENIKITTSTDFYVLKALLDERENNQAQGL